MASPSDRFINVITLTEECKNDVKNNVKDVKKDVKKSSSLLQSLATQLFQNLQKIPDKFF